MNGAVDELRPTRCGVEKTPWPLCVVTPRAARRTYALMYCRKRVRSVDANMCAKNIVCRARTAPPRARRSAERARKNTRGLILTFYRPYII